MRDPGSVREVLGRDGELEAVAHWAERVTEARADLVIGGPAGIGKSTIWEVAIARARERGATVLVSRPAEAELALAYAGLGDLLAAAVAPIIDGLPAPQAEALSAALLLGATGRPGSPLLVASATTNALRRLAAAGPVVLAVDDAQWLDAASARALAFAVRRLDDLRVGVALTLRSGHADPLALEAERSEHATVLRLGGLDLESISSIIRSRVADDVPRRRMARIHDRSGGNPMFALQLAVAGAEIGPLPASLEGLVEQRLLGAPKVASQAIEVVAVLGPTPIAGFTQPGSLDAAAAAGILVEDGGIVRFAHPLLAAGAYARIPPVRRRALHAEAAAAAGSLETKAHHLALATLLPNTDVAAVLDDAARAARARSAPELAAELAGHAGRLTPAADVDARARRTMDQAEYLFVTADERAARALVDGLLTEDIDGTTRVRALTQRALTATDAASAVSILEEAVAEPHEDRVLYARTLAQLAWQRGGWLGDVDAAIPEAEKALSLAESLGDASVLVTALTTTGLLLSLAGRPGAADRYRRALEIIERVPTAAGDHTPRLAFATERWWRGDFATAEALLEDERRIAEQHGDEGLLMRLAIFGAEFDLRRGRWDDAERGIEASLADARDYWRMIALIRRAILRARRGDDRALADAEELRLSPLATDSIFPTAGRYAAGLLAFAAGNLDAAADDMAALPDFRPGTGSRANEYAMLAPETVTVLVLAGRLPEARVVRDHLAIRRESLSPWADAAVTLCDGLIELGAGNAEAALLHLEGAVAGFEAIGAPWELGQALLAQGGALRRLGQRRRAAESLDQADAIFAGLAAAPARARVAEELGRARPRPRMDHQLTPAETRVAELVAEGATNREAAARLFTTVATVEAHLTRIYAKLEVRSRTELARRLAR